MMKKTSAPIGESEVKLPALSGNYDRQSNQPTDRPTPTDQPTDRPTDKRTDGLMGKYHFQKGAAVEKCNFCQQNVHKSVGRFLFDLEAFKKC